MITIREFLKAKLNRYGIDASDNEMEVATIDAGVAGDYTTAPYEAENATAPKKALVFMVRDILAQPDVSEGEYSANWDRSSVQKLHDSLCREIGLENTQPTVQDLSNIW